jgi:RNA polymerase-binding transcription factor DksA
MTRTSCDVCGKPFEARRRDAVHCSPACARAAYAKRHLPTVEGAIAYLEREARRLRNLLPGGTRRRGRPPRQAA